MELACDNPCPAVFIERPAPRRLARNALPVAACWLIATALSSSATAQSSVSLFGILDLGPSVQTHAASARGDTFRALNSSVWNPSQWGVRGQEDLGGGASAFFGLGSTILADTGGAVGAKFFDRNAFVGLAHKQWGSLTLGRQVSTLAETIYATDPFSTHNSGNNMNSRFGYLLNPGPVIAGHFGPTPTTAPGIGLDRVDNALKYTFRSESTGLTGSAMFGAGEGVGGRAHGAMLGFDGSGLTARGSYMLYRDVDGIPFKAYASGATYQSGALTFKASYVLNRIDSALDTVAKPYRDLKTKVAGIGATWTVAALELNVAYYRGTRTQNGQPEQVARKLHIGPEYKLSKRTALAGVVVFSKFNAAGAALDPSVAGGSDRSTYLGAAISHRF